MTRVALPTRRRNETRLIAWRGSPLSVSVGFDDAGAPKEVFANGAKEGSDMAHTIADACVVISIALQHGIAAGEMRKSLGTVPDFTAGGPVAAPASVIGAILGVVEETALVGVGG